MTPRMTQDELKLFTWFVACAGRYLEFGAGGSTCVAAARVATSVISVESARDWIDQVAAECARHPGWVQPQLHHVDIGRTGNWGFPTDPATRVRWPDYHSRIWEQPDAAGADLFMVDGRFRVACCAQIALHARPDALVMVHDYNIRPNYHVVEGFLRPVSRTGGLCVFQRRSGHDPGQVRAVLEAHAHDPD